MRLHDCDDEIERISTTSDPTTITQSFLRLMQDYPDVNLGFGRGSIYWRARICDECGFPYQSDMNYPPIENTRVGRLNEARRPCLYLSGKRETALAEIGAKDGDFAQITGFRVMADKVLRTIAIGELSHVQKTGYLRITGVDPDKTIARIINGYRHERGLRILYIDAFFGSVLADPSAAKSGYLKTRLLASLLYARSPAAAMFYPSVQSALGINLAVLADQVGSLMHPVASVVVRVKRKLRFGYFDLEHVRTAQDVDSEGRYVWRKPDHAEQMFVFHMSKEERDYMASRGASLLDLPTYRNV